MMVFANMQAYKAAVSVRNLFFPKSIVVYLNSCAFFNSSNVKSPSGPIRIGKLFVLKHDLRFDFFSS
jgi:hypothetical protein